MELVSFLIVISVIASLVILAGVGFGLYWLIRLAVRHGNADASQAQRGDVGA